MKRVPKFSQVRFDFKSLKENLPLHIQNARNRQVKANPQKTVQLYEEYKKHLYEIEMMRKRKNQHAET